MIREAGATFACFGGTCAVRVASADPEPAVAAARDRMLDWHGRFSRFSPGSELSRLNADAREVVPVGEELASLLSQAVAAAHLTGGLVDPTLLDALESAGYAGDLRPSPPSPPSPPSAYPEAM